MKSMREKLIDERMRMLEELEKAQRFLKREQDAVAHWQKEITQIESNLVDVETMLSALVEKEAADILGGQVIEKRILH